MAFCLSCSFSELIRREETIFFTICLQPHWKKSTTKKKLGALFLIRKTLVFNNFFDVTFLFFFINIYLLLIWKNDFAIIFKTTLHDLPDANFYYVKNLSLETILNERCFFYRVNMIVLLSKLVSSLLYYWVVF